MTLVKLSYITTDCYHTCSHGHGYLYSRTLAIFPNDVDNTMKIISRYTCQRLFFCCRSLKDMSILFAISQFWCEIVSDILRMGKTKSYRAPQISCQLVRCKQRTIYRLHCQPLERITRTKSSSYLANSQVM